MNEVASTRGQSGLENTRAGVSGGHDKSRTAVDPVITEKVVAFFKPAF